MRLKIVRDLTPEEVEQKIKSFERLFDTSFDRFQELFLEQKLNSKFTAAYYEWADLVDSYKGYVEGGELNYTVEEFEDFKPEQTALLTAKRMELLYQLASVRVDSISDLSKKVKRNVKNVYQDLEVLKRLGFVRLSRRRGRALVPETPVKEITFLIS